MQTLNLVSYYEGCGSDPTDIQTGGKCRAAVIIGAHMACLAAKFDDKICGGLVQRNIPPKCAAKDAAKLLRKFVTSKMLFRNSKTSATATNRQVQKAQSTWWGTRVGNEN